MTNPRTRLSTVAAGLALLAAACGSTPADTARPPASSSTPAPSVAVSPVGSAGPSAATPSGSARPSAAEGCSSPATQTLAQTEGPYYLAGAPEVADLVAEGMAGTRLTFTGVVVDTSCGPVAGARVETWQADGAGVYDNAGYTLRGWVLTDEEGRFTIRTIVPGEYPGRTEHVHVKVTPPGGATLTTQMYFPGSTVNDEDGIYHPSLELAITQDGGALVGEFTFVVGG